MIRETEFVSHPRQDEKERAYAILTACADKPIRRVTTEMLGNRTRLLCKSHEIRSVPKSEIEKAEQRQLQTRIFSYLLEHGASTGKELAVALDSNVGKIGNACKHAAIGRRELRNDKHKSHNTLFYIIRGD